MDDRPAFEGQAREAEVRAQQGRRARPDGAVLATYAWLPAADREVRGVVYLAHGMEEHAGRYCGLGRALAARGFAVHAHDHRGHGATARGDDRRFPLSHVSRHGGWAAMVGDLEAGLVEAGARHPGVPLALVGHSMGSVLARDVAMRQGRRDIAGRLAGRPATGPAGHASGHVDALALLGTPGVPPAAPLLHLVLRVMARARGWEHVSRPVQRLVFGSYNHQFRPVRTDADWMSRDAARVDEIEADPWCGEVASLSFWRDLLAGTVHVNCPREVGVRRGPWAASGGLFAGLPMLFFSGARDAAGGNGRWVRRAAALARRAGARDVTVTLVPGARHSLHEEIDREGAYDHLGAWLDSRLARN